MKVLGFVVIVVAFAAATLATAHQLSHEVRDDSALIFASAFAVFALLLPAAGLLREYGERQLNRAVELVRAGTTQDVRESLRSQSSHLRILADRVWFLQWGIGFAVVAALAASLSLVFPKIVLWHHAPAWMTCSARNLLAGGALVALLATVLFTIPFTWALLVTSSDLKDFSDVLDLAIGKTVPAAPTAVQAIAKGGGVVEVSWAAPPGNVEVSSYLVTPNLNQQAQTTTEVLSAPTSTTISGLTAGTSVTFTVTAKNDNGVSQASQPSAAITVT